MEVIRAVVLGKLEYMIVDGQLAARDPIPVPADQGAQKRPVVLVSSGLVEPEDDQSFLFLARDGDAPVATIRLSWGGHGFSERQIRQYSLAPFLAELPAELLAVGERAMVEPQGGGEFFGGAVFNPEATHTITIRYWPGLLPSMRVNFQGRLFEIVNINDYEERHIWMKIQAKEGRSHGIV